MVDQIDYVKKRLVVHHVAISSDFNHGGGVTGWKTADEAGNVTAELVKRGCTPADIAKIWSGNVLRLLDAAQS